MKNIIFLAVFVLAAQFGFSADPLISKQTGKPPRTPIVPEKPAENPDFEKGYELYNEGKYDEAMPFFEKVMSLDPGHLRARVYYGVCFMGKQDFERAIVELEKALKMDEKFPLTNYALAVSYARKQSPDVQKAESYLNTAKQSGYQVPVWFEQYVERLKTGKVPPQQQPKTT